MMYIAYYFYLATFLAFAPSLTSATTPPSYSGYSTVWHDSFTGATGTAPNSALWNTITGYLGVNSELETYTSSNKNVQISGGQSLQLVPWKDSSATYGWTSGRLESVYTFTPKAGGRTMAEASIRLGSNSQANKQGMWPAFWLLGDSIRHGTSWPACGELDIMESVDGYLTGYGTVHCNISPGGICNEPNGIGSSIGIPDYTWHTWRIVWDNTASSWTGETISWYMDGNLFQQISGSRIGDQATWNALAHSAVYFILNVAVGGSWVSSLPTQKARYVELMQPFTAWKPQLQFP
jgi:beta-glucanase (GH16 family)